MIIVGGGPAGATVAMGLARRGVKATLLEAQPGPEAKIGECLPPNVSALLERLGIQDRLGRKDHLAFYGNRSWWGSAMPVERDFLFGTRGSGWQLDRRKFEETLAQMAREQGAEWLYGCRLLECCWVGSNWELRARSAAGVKTFEADFVVDATGRNATLARRLGAHQIRYDRLIGAAVTMKADDDTGSRDSFTILEAVESGWWYAARLPERQLIVVYLTDSDLVDHKALSRIDNWLGLLEKTQHASRRVRDGAHRSLADPRILAANSARLSSIAGERWLAVGDAATAHDPLASYGIAAALGGGFNAAAAIADCLAGNYDAISRYSRLIDHAFAQYLLLHHEYYGLERRWPQQTFWRRRHVATTIDVKEYQHGNDARGSNKMFPPFSP